MYLPEIINNGISSTADYGVGHARYEASSTFMYPGGSPKGVAEGEIAAAETVEESVNVMKWMLRSRIHSGFVI